MKRLEIKTPIDILPELILIDFLLGKEDYSNHISARARLKQLLSLIKDSGNKT